MPTILITGGTGLIGKALSELLMQKGYSVIILTRKPAQQKMNTQSGLSYAGWNVSKQLIDIAAVQQADYIIHLAGAGVADKRWTSKRKKEILLSRTQSSALLVKTLTDNNNQVKAVISASAIGWYGADPLVPNPNPFVETDPPDGAFLGQTCRQWEESIEPVVALGKRLVTVRTGIVLSRAGGAMNEFVKPLRFGIAAILGSGKQVISWVHIDDLCRIYLQAIEDEKMVGAWNAVAPKPLANKEFTIRLAKAIKKNFYIPLYIPSWVLKLVLGQMSIEVLKSATVSAKKLRTVGYQFLYPSPEAAINQLTSKN
ncbi:MAG: TIGR01777 family oxidoreductase [Bacteroidota bacterium]